MRALTWNLFHGRALPPRVGDLQVAFTEKLAAWEWDVALLQEVPPWWPARLALATGSEAVRALTSRNLALPLRRLIAQRRPEFMKANGGGSNVVLARSAIVESKQRTLRRWPERRVAQFVRLRDGTCVVNYHASARVALAERELERIWEQALQWAQGAPLIVGGDLNLRSPSAPVGVAHLASRDVDHIFARGFALEHVELPTRRVTLAGEPAELSDHPPLLVTIAPEAADPSAVASA